MLKKNPELPGMESADIAEIDAKIAEYVTFKRERMKNKLAEFHAKRELIALMKKHDMKIYRNDDYLATRDEQTVDVLEVEKVDDEGRAASASNGGEAKNGV